MASRESYNAALRHTRLCEPEHTEGYHNHRSPHLVQELRPTGDSVVGVHFTDAEADKVLRTAGERALINGACLNLIVHCRRIFIIHCQMPEKAKATLALAARVGQLLDDIEITSVAAVVSPGGPVREHIDRHCHHPAHHWRPPCYTIPEFPDAGEFCRAESRSISQFKKVHVPQMPGTIQLEASVAGGVGRIVLKRAGLDVKRRGRAVFNTAAPLAYGVLYQTPLPWPAKEPHSDRF